MRDFSGGRTTNLESGNQRARHTLKLYYLCGVFLNSKSYGLKI
jgi:hypothetical protein